MEKKTNNQKKKVNLGVIIQLLIGGIIGLLGSVLLIDYFENNDWSFQNVLLSVLFFILAIFININIHEFGHFTFGKVLGYRLLSYRVSFLTWNNENGKMKFSIIKNKGYSGLCAMIPPEQELPAFKQILFYSGGIIFNVVTGVIFLTSVNLVPNLPDFITLFFVILSSLAFLLGIINFIPFFSGNFASDGKIIWSILLKQPFAKQLTEYNKITAQLSAGVRPRDLLFTYNHNSDTPQMFDMYILLYSYFKAVDNQNIEEMVLFSEMLEKNLEFFPDPSLPALYYELCYIGCITDNKEQANYYYQKAGRILQQDNDSNGLRVKAYYEYYIKNELESANTLCNRAIAVADRFPIKGQGIMELELIHSLKRLMNVH
jgi:hypothetical protein